MPQPNTSVSIKENALLQKILRKPKKRVKEKCEWYVSTIQVDLKMVQENTIIFPFWNEPMTIDYLWNPEVFNICNHSNFYNFIRFSPVPIPFSFFQVSWIVRLPSPWKIDLFISSYLFYLTFPPLGKMGNIQYLFDIQPPALFDGQILSKTVCCSL